MKSGLLKRRFPAVRLAEASLADFVRPGAPISPADYVESRRASSAKFFFDLGCLPKAESLCAVAGEQGKQRTVSVADDFARGRFLYYSRHVFDIGWPPDWLRNPFTGARYDELRHWCDTPTFSPAMGDIKDVWEPSRFACAFWLVRAYAMTGDAAYPSAFWEMFESWCRQNPPNIGPNWKCGQETALRIMAWCFALFGFWKAAATTPERVVNMLKLIALQADRVAGNIAYAISQKNNHALSEAVGLLTVGLLFPELRRAGHWLALGRRVLEEQVPRQIAEDGGYVQQSMNYHRVMLHDCLWAIRLAELNGAPLSDELKSRVAKAGDFLFQMLDLDSGRVPNYGANDGALVLPLAACDYVDYRPTVQAARYPASGEFALPPGPWDEMPLWLFGKDVLAAMRSAEKPASRRFDSGGYYTLRHGRSWCMVRCHTYRTRPAHVDMLHLDLWHGGVNLLGDSGTYGYFTPDNPALERSLRDIQAHNTVEIDGAGPLELVSRFLWMPWPAARCLEHRDDFWQGEHYAYDRAPWHVVHRRTVENLNQEQAGSPGPGPADAEQWRITDDILGDGEHEVTLRWHMADGQCVLNEVLGCVELRLPKLSMLLTVLAPEGRRMRFARGADPRKDAVGWVSDYYAELRPRPTLEITTHCRLPVRFVTSVCAVGESRT